MPSSEVHVLTAADPVTAFVEADRIGVPVALPTSGTSGRPRTVVRTTASWTDSFDAVSELTGTTSASRVWVPGPVTATISNSSARDWVKWSHSDLLSSTPDAASSCLMLGRQPPQVVPAEVQPLTAAMSPRTARQPAN
mgnify:CR=1 FL=1